MMTPGLKTPAYSAIVIGASMGGLSALKSILSGLPADYCLPIMVVQHLLPESDGFLSEYLSSKLALDVVLPDSGEQIKTGVVYLAPPGYHLLVENDETFSLSIDPPVNYSIPSIDVLFESAADVYREKLIGIVLTGASDDGSQGLKMIKTLGGLTIVQDPVSAEADIMPKAAIAAVAIDHILQLDKISALLRTICNG